MDDQPYIDAVMPEAEKILASPARALRVAVVKTKFPWVKEGRIVWARTSDLRSAMFWVVLGRPPVYLGGPDALERLSDLVVASTGPLPRGLPPVALAEAIRQLTFDPRGRIGSAAFLAEVTPNLEHFLPEDDAPSRALFASFCADPAIEDRGQGRFALGFHAFNVDGGVERWLVEGDASRFTGVTRTTAAPDGTFRWPYA